MKVLYTIDIAVFPEAGGGIGSVEASVCAEFHAVNMKK